MSREFLIEQCTIMDDRAIVVGTVVIGVFNLGDKVSIQTPTVDTEGVIVGIEGYRELLSKAEEGAKVVLNLRGEKGIESSMIEDLRDWPTEAGGTIS